MVAINPNLKLPSLDDNGFKLFERWVNAHTVCGGAFSSDNHLHGIYTKYFCIMTVRDILIGDATADSEFPLCGHEPLTNITVIIVSVAILRYLATKFNTPDHWYPKDLQTRAKVDEALAWFPGNLRSGLFPHAVSMRIFYSFCCD